MTTRAVEQFDEWESSPFRDGYRGLRELADGGFSGIIQAGAAKLCMLSGTAVGVLDGDIEDFEDATGTAYEAPSPALPLLALMQDRNDEVRAKYYSEDTPIAEVDGTLADGGFTGFIELSENVLSGDYYVVYHQGRSMAVAWVGNSGQLLTEDEAFERADDEVGIFEVRPAELEPVEIPDAAAEPAGGAAAADSDDSDADTAQDTDEEADEPVAADTPDTDDTVEPTAETDATDVDASAADSEVVDDPVSTEQPDSDETRDEPASSDTVDPTASESTDETGTATAADAEPSNQATEPSDRAAESDTARSEESRTPSRGDDRGEARTRDRDTTERSRDTAERDRTTDRDRSSPRDRGRDRGTAASESEPRTDRTGEPGRERADRTDTSGRPEPADRQDEGVGSADPERDPTADQVDTTAESPPTAESPGRSESASQRDAGASGGAAGTPDQLATHTIPSLDPARTTTPATESESEAAAVDPEPDPVDTATTAAAAEPTEPAPKREPSGPEARDPNPRDDRTSEPAGARTSERNATEPTGESGAQVADLEAELAEREAEIRDLEADLSAAESDREDLRADLERVRSERDDLRSQLDGLESERDQLQEERDRLESEVADLEAEVERLESQIDEIEAEFGAAVDADQRLSPGEALDQTNLFVRYESKGKATLETAHAGEATREEVGKNLGLEYHTQFDHETASVGGRPFDEFLRETMQYRFVTWVINDLLYEIRDTGKTAELQDLYDAIPKIDRAELNGAVATEYVEDGQERRSQESFDVVLRDRMGNALLTANMNDSRQAASESMMSSLVTASSHVGESTETLGASFLVTSSFFEPEALETASEATSGGLLSRDKRASFVKLSRKQGYHLCLVEAREDKFHLAVPEL